MKIMERQSLVRISKIDQELRCRPYTPLYQLMEETGSSRRTVFRDIDALQQMGAPRDFDYEQYLGKAWGIIKGKKTKVVLDFDQSQAVFLKEKQWHPSQKLSKPQNGKIRMTLTVDGIDEILWWILSYGSRVKVVEPRSLAEQVKNELMTSLNKYK
ncbi:protein containing WYL domain [Candidatus Termititenax dinenymphae]|uniref:Protein containing WYL domain n=1 Tax=Candidatus Termititenax dinenymphae TaxID=2218523 RepID=A0A388TJG8_9BACT|nr:protein containing WYL domain [Candidatus Termititenax dinenymphae]